MSAHRIIVIGSILSGMFFFIASVSIGQDKSGNGNVHVSASFGFRVSRPSDSWVFRQTSLGAPASHVFKITLRKSSGRIEATIAVTPQADGESKSANEYRDEALAKTLAKDNFSGQRKITVEIAGISAPGLQLDWKLAGGVYRVQQCYLSHDERVYTIAVHGPADKFDSLAPTFAEITQSFGFVELTPEIKLENRIKRLTARCGSELKWANSWDEASKKAAAEKKSILYLIRSQPGFDLPDAITNTALMNEDVIEFLNEHCIALRHQLGMTSPIVSYDHYGIGPSSFGITALLTEPDGTVFGDTMSPDPDVFYDFLITSFRNRGGQTPDPADQNPVSLADSLAIRGEFDAALESIAEIDGDARVHRLRASIYRRRRQAEYALAELARARNADDDPDLQADCLIDESLIKLAAGHISGDTALQAFVDLAEKFPEHSRAGELQYYIGLCQLALEQSENARKTWLEYVKTADEDNRWAWRTAAMLQSRIFELQIDPRLTWPDRDEINAFRAAPFEPVSLDRVDQAQQDAIQYLLAHQRTNGSWISPPEALRASSYPTSPLTIAVTSICAKSLLPHRANPKIARAVDQALQYLCKEISDRKHADDKPFYMDYSPWGDAYLLSFLAHYRDAMPDTKKQKIDRCAEQVLARLKQKQKPGGGWSYYITHDIRNVNRPSNQSISFMTAAVAISLLKSQQAGFEVSQTMIDRSLDCLERMKNSNTTFTYFLWHERENDGRQAGEEGSAGRGPLCSLALHLGNRGDAKEIRSCLKLFMKYRGLYERERGKTLMHAAPGGQGSHYLMFDYAWAVEAMDALPEEQRAEFRGPLLELVLGARTRDGSFIDNPINGWHYGTAMALESLEKLSPGASTKTDEIPRAKESGR